MLSNNYTIGQAKVIVSIMKDGRKIIDLDDCPHPKEMSPGLHEVQVTLPPFFLSAGQYGVKVLCFSDDETKLWACGKPKRRQTPVCYYRARHKVIAGSASTTAMQREAALNAHFTFVRFSQSKAAPCAFDAK